MISIAFHRGSVAAQTKPPAALTRDLNLAQRVSSQVASRNSWPSQVRRMGAKALRPR